MLNQGWQNAFTASVLAVIVLFVIPRACGGEADRDAAESAECFVLWDGQEYAIDCSAEETKENEADDFDPAEL